MSAASAQRIIKAAEKRDRVVMVGMNHRYRPDVQIVRSFVQSGELGTIESVRGSWHVFRPEPRPAGLATEKGSGRRRRDAGPGPLDPRPRTLARRQPGAGAGERVPGCGRKGSRGGAVGQRVRGVRERDVALRGRHLASPGRRRAVRGRPPGEQGERGDQPAHGVEGDARRAGGCVADRLWQPGERVHRLVPRRVGPLPGRDRGRGEGRRRSRITWCCTRCWTRSTGRHRTGETWSCEAGRRVGVRRAWSRVWAGLLVLAALVALRHSGRGRPPARCPPAAGSPALDRST